MIKVIYHTQSYIYSIEGFEQACYIYPIVVYTIIKSISKDLFIILTHLHVHLDTYMIIIMKLI